MGRSGVALLSKVLGIELAVEETVAGGEVRYSGIWGKRK